MKPYRRRRVRCGWSHQGSNVPVSAKDWERGGTEEKGAQACGATHSPWLAALPDSQFFVELSKRGESQQEKEKCACEESVFSTDGLYGTSQNARNRSETRALIFRHEFSPRNLVKIRLRRLITRQFVSEPPQKDKNGQTCQTQDEPQRTNPVFRRVDHSVCALGRQA